MDETLTPSPVIPEIKIMGWLFPYHCTTKQEMVNDILRPQEHVRILEHSLRGNILWTVEQGKKNDGTWTQNMIACYLLRSSRESHCWGYKDMTEAMHPYYYTCPLKFLEMAPIANNDWRVGVYAYHEAKSQQRQAFKGLKVGCKVQLKPTCSIMGDRVTAPIEIISLKPLTGTLNGMMVRIKKTHIASIL